MTLKDEIDDVLDELQKKKKSGFLKEIREREQRTNAWALRYGKRKIPRYVEHLWSHHKDMIGLARGYYHTFGFATKVIETGAGKQKKYHLMLYDTVARHLK